MAALAVLKKFSLFYHLINIPISDSFIRIWSKKMTKKGADKIIPLPLELLSQTIRDSYLNFYYSRNGLLLFTTCTSFKTRYIEKIFIQTSLKFRQNCKKRITCCGSNSPCVKFFYLIFRCIHIYNGPDRRKLEN